MRHLILLVSVLQLLEVHLHPVLCVFDNDKHPSQEIDVLVNGELYQHIHLTQPEGNRLKITLTPKMKAAKYLTIEFVIANPVRPADLSINVPDKRKLGIGIVSAIFR